jgi:nitrous oxidase accessory protein
MNRFLNLTLPVLILLGAVVNAKTITVCESCTINSIKKGIASAQSFDTLFVKKGVYREHSLRIDKPLTLMGENHPIIDGNKEGEIITVLADNVTIDGFFIINVGRSYTEDYAAIRIKRSNYFEIKNVVLEKLFFGIYIEKSNYGQIYHNKIIGDAKEEYNSGNGIQLWYSNHVVIENNHVQGVRDGIYLEFANHCSLKGNTSTNNIRYGLHFMFSNNDLYQDNHFENNGAGVAVMFSKKIKMIGNHFKKNWGTASYGMLLKEINDAEIRNNIFDENTIGINIEGANRILYKNNDFINN